MYLAKTETSSINHTIQDNGRNAKKESGIYTTAHPLRHTYATIVFESGISEKDDQMLPDHSSIVVTHNIYTHIRATRMQDTADKLNNYVSQSLEKPSEES